MTPTRNVVCSAFLFSGFGLSVILGPKPSSVPPRVCESIVASVSASDADPAHGSSNASRYHWPSLHGSSWPEAGSPWKGPADFATSVAWTWQHPQGKFYTFCHGSVVDGSKNIYLACVDAVRKLSPSGALLWQYCPPQEVIGGRLIPSVPALLDGALFGQTQSGTAFALDMETGRELWLKQVDDRASADSSSVGAHDGVVVLGTGHCGQTWACGNNGNAGGSVVRALSAKDGNELWSFRPDIAVWNFYPIFPGDGTVLYQDLAGRVYRHTLHDGALLWKRDGLPESWSDGSIGAGPNRTVFAVTTHGNSGNKTDGSLTKYTLDGKVLWRATTKSAPNSFPAVGPSFRGNGQQSVIVCGGPGLAGNNVQAFDAETGALQWEWTGPPQYRPGGDEEGLSVRQVVLPEKVKYYPNMWSNALVDVDGTVYVGINSGHLFRIRDANRNGVIEDAEVQWFHTVAGFAGAGFAMAPGLLVVTSLDTLFVFRTPES